MRLASDLRSEKRNGHIVAVWLALATGVRRGEALGLMWKDVDFRRKRIIVGQQWAHDKKLRAPKSEKSMRWIGIDDGTVLFLKEWKAQQAREMEVQGMDQGRETPVCTSSTYGPNGADASTRHDMRVYIHYCLNCKRIIDSREWKLVDEDGYYLCMYCGASKAFDAATVYPVCGNTDRKALGYFVGSMRDELDYRSRRKPYGELLIRCKARGCGYDAREFKSEFE